MSNCADELGELVNKHFAFLLQEGFRISSTSERRSGVDCFAILKSDHCSYKLRITSEMGLINIFVSSIDAPEDWDDTNWYYIKNVLDYLDGFQYSLSERIAFDKHMRSLSRDDRIRFWVNRICEKEDQISAIFNDSMGRSIADLDAYVRDRRKALERELAEEASGSSKG